MISYCRLCLETAETFEPIDDANAVTNRHKIGTFLPEVAIDSVDHHVLCANCAGTLRLMHDFKLKCMETEAMIEKHIKTNDVARPVSLKSVIDGLNASQDDIEFVKCDDYAGNPGEEELIVLIDTAETNLDEIKKETYDLHSAVEIKLESCDENKPIDVDATYKCHVCNEVFLKFWMMKKHMKTHATCLRCNECGKIFNSEFNHTKHLLSHKTDCMICGKVFSRRCHLRVHLADIHGCMDEMGRHKCPRCEAAFYTETALRKHEVTVHSVEKDGVEYDEAPEEPIEERRVIDADRWTVKCEDCNKIFNSKYYLERHRTTHKRDCEVCRKQFSSHSHLRAHLGDVHGCTDETGRHKCDHCDACYYTEGALFKHVTIHSIKKGYFCTVCDKECTTQYQLKRHLRYHAECDKYECEYCQAKFALKSVLVTHIRRHTGEKPYKCEKCGRAFSQRGSLSTHLRDIHNGAKRFSCHLCQTQFKYRATLLLHVQKHNGTVEKSHVCDVCGKAFRLAFALRGHILRHKNVKSYTCVICGMGFVDSCGLKRHMKTHTGEKPHQCHLCSFRCSQKSNLRIHVKSHLRKKDKR